MKIRPRNFDFHPIRSGRKFAPFKVNVKSAKVLEGTVAKNARMRRVIKQVFSKKAAVTAGVGTAVGLGVASIWNYIESNSGCFKKLRNGSVCKVQELSCCQKGSLDNVPNCSGMASYRSVCDQEYDDSDASCCKLCSCAEMGCDESEEMRCQRPTISDALAHFAATVKEGVGSALVTLFPWAPYVLYAGLALLALWAVSVAWPVLNRFLPRRKQEDA